MSEYKKRTLFPQIQRSADPWFMNLVLALWCFDVVWYWLISFMSFRVTSQWRLHHYTDSIISTMAFQRNSLTIVYWGADQRKLQSSASLAFVRGIHRWPVNSPHKGPVTRKMFPFDDVSMINPAVSETQIQKNTCKYDKWIHDALYNKNKQTKYNKSGCIFHGTGSHLVSLIPTQIPRVGYLVSLMQTQSDLWGFSITIFRFDWNVLARVDFYYSRKSFTKWMDEMNQNVG